MSDTFGVRLGRILIDRDMTQNDLARLVFNEPGVDNRGYHIWKGKDRISSWVNGRQLPSSRNYCRLLEVLALRADDLPLNRGEFSKLERGPSWVEKLREENARLVSERDHWRDTARQLSEVVAALAVQMKERRQ